MSKSTTETNKNIIPDSIFMKTYLHFCLYFPIKKAIIVHVIAKTPFLIMEMLNNKITKAKALDKKCK